MTSGEAWNTSFTQMGPFTSGIDAPPVCQSNFRLEGNVTPEVCYTYDPPSGEQQGDAPLKKRRRLKGAFGKAARWVEHTVSAGIYPWEWEGPRATVL